MNKKIIVIISVVLLLCAVGGAWYFISTGESEEAKAETWKGIYKNTKYIDEHERVVVTVEITEENDVRGIDVTMYHGTSDDASLLMVDNRAELALDKTGKISFSMKAVVPPEGSEISAESVEDVYIELEYVDEDTISFKYGNSKEEMEACEAIELINLAG